MSRFLCDIKIAKKSFEYFVNQYKKRHPDFRGEIRQAAWDIGVAEIIDGDTMKPHRFARF